ncbi:MAG: hypothetical protein OER97_09335 [Gammaproteobacteria bacterium]|nr:hypothetical protein [Gammaproteobacteria bacterium]
MRPSVFIALILLSAVTAADESKLDIGGHTKFNLTAQTFPDDSLFRDLIGSNSLDLQGDLRLNLKWRSERWTFDAAYQLIALHEDSLALAGSQAFSAFGPLGELLNDDRRLFDLTDIIDESSQNAVLHRLDRLWAGYANDKAVVRFGRQVLSWGNGLFYTPMDLVNPFDPAAIDTEYKTGDDMLYVQYLRDNGDDMQAAIVFRRDPLTGDVESDQATSALKYHGFTDEYEFDVLIAESYDDTVIGLGVSRGIGGAHWSADLVVTDARTETYVEFVSNLSYSWTLADRNMSGLLEYFFSGLGQHGERYDPASLAGNPDLLARLVRGQSFTIGRNYLAGSVTIEMTPLWNVSPLLLANLGDPSALLQLTSNYSLSDNMTLLGSINIPIGSNGSEFGGIDSGIPDRYFSTGFGLFAQFAWYF